MGITLNKVGVEIDGKVYHFYKLSFGFQRKLIEVQSNLSKVQNEISKKYNISVDEINDSKDVPDEDKLEVARLGLELQDAIKSLFVNKEESDILDNFDGDNLTELIEALK